MDIVRLLRLDRAGKDGRVPIHMRVCWQGNKVRLSSGEKVLPADWDEDKGEVKRRAKFAADINRRLDIYQTGLKEFTYKYQNTGTAVTEEMIRAEVERIRVEVLHQKKASSKPAPEPGTPTLPSVFEFNKRYRQEHLLAKSESWHKTVRVVGDHLAAFRPNLSWDGLVLSTLNLFKVYLQQEEEVSDATLQAYIGTLRGMLKYAGKSGLQLPADWTYLEVRRAGDALQPELESPEVSQLLNAKLYQPETRPKLNDQVSWGKFDIDTIESTRWYFGIACHTGLRHSDLWQLQTPKITTIEGYPCLEIIQRKTQKRVPIPLTDDVYHLVRNPIRQGPPSQRDQYNFMLKHIGQQAELEREVLTGTYYRGELLAEVQPLYNTMNSHMARRTFATLMTAGGMPTKTLQEIMGHADIASTAKYSKVSSGTIIRQTIEAWRHSSSSNKPHP